MKLYTLGSIAALGGAVVAACSSGGGAESQLGTSDGGVGPDGSEPPAGDRPLSDAAASSPNLAKCKIACEAPTDGPCKDADVTDCIEKCTVFLEGMSASCVQCIVESSGWAGKRCPSECKCCPCIESFGPSGTGCGKCPVGATPSCDPSEETCTGYSLAKTSSGACQTACQ
jgi:hypothetical protein